jgi:hypothetical protein
MPKQKLLYVTDKAREKNTPSTPYLSADREHRA